MSVAASRLPAQRARVLRSPRTDERTRLEVVGPRARRRTARRAAPLLAAAAVSASLFAVVVAHALVAQEQVKLAAVEAALTQAQVVHRHEVVSLAKLENPSRILREAESALHMVTPGGVTQLPHVTLGVAVAAPEVAAGTAPTTSTQAASPTSPGASAPPPSSSSVTSPAGA